MNFKHAKTILNLLTYTVVILLICFITPKLLQFFMPFVIGWIIAALANPLVKFFEKRLKIVRKHGSLVVIVGALALVIAGCYFLLAWLFQEGIAFVKSIPDSYFAIVDDIRETGTKFSTIFDKLPADIENIITEFFINIDSYIGSLIGKIGIPTLNIVGDITKNIPNLFIMTIFMLLSAYFFVADKEKISIEVRKVIPQSVIDNFIWIKEIFSKAVVGYFKAQFKIMVVITVILWIGFFIMQVKYAALLAVLIAFLDLLPFFGTGTVIWPWAAFKLLSGDYPIAAGLMIIYVICLLVHQLLQPKFIGDTVGLDSLTTLFCMFIGYRFRGVLGIIIAIPIGIIIINLYKAGAFDKIVGDVKDMVADFNEFRRE